MSMYDVSGAHDMHIHSSPDTAERVGDDLEIAEVCLKAGYKSILLKSHFESTVSRAKIAQKFYPDLNIFGSITLNTPVGGINPTAVEIALKLGAKEIFMPTSYSSAHAMIHGKPGAYKHRSSDFRVESKAISIIDENDNLLPEIITILELARDYGVPIGTAHLSKGEILLLTKAASEIKTKLIITHPHFHPPNLDDATLELLVSLGVKIELCAGTVFPVPGFGRVDQVVQTIKKIGYRNCYISSDAGALTKPLPPDTLRPYLYGLSIKGIPKEHLEYMYKEHPVELFGI